MSEVLRTIIFPFEYDDSYMPLLSEKNFGYLSAPFPVLIGIVNTAAEDMNTSASSIYSSKSGIQYNDLYYEVEQNASDKSLLVYLDEKELRVKFEDEILTLPDFMEKIDDNGKPFSGKHFPTKNIKELKKSLGKIMKTLQKRLMKDRRIVTIREKEEFVGKIREEFLYFFVSLFKNYSKYLPKNMDQAKGAQENFTTSFNSVEFMKKEYKGSSQFFDDFFKTRAWIVFLENKMLQKGDGVNPVNLFDKKIQAKYAKRKSKESFKIMEEYKFVEPELKRKEYTLPQLEEEYFKHIDDNGIQYSDYCEVIQSDGKNYLNYSIIPDFSATSIPNEISFPPEDFAENLCKADQTEKVDNQRLILDGIRTFSREQHILVCWILLWCMSFKYLQSIEKKIRIQELIMILNRLFKVTQYPIQSVRFLEYILTSVLESGRKEHIDTMMETINELNIPMSLQMQQIYFQCFDKERTKAKKRPPIVSMNSTVDMSSASSHKGYFKDALCKKEDNKSFDQANLKRRREVKLLETVIKSGKLRRRTFKSYSQRKNFLMDETLFFKIPGECDQPNCSKIMDNSQIFKPLNLEETSFQCFFCGKDMSYFVDVYIGYHAENDAREEAKHRALGCVRREYHSNTPATSIKGSFHLKTEFEMLNFIKNLYNDNISDDKDHQGKFDLMILREHRKGILFNCILFFKTYGLPFDFILPFEDYEVKYAYEKTNQHTSIQEVFSPDDIK